MVNTPSLNLFSVTKCHMKKKSYLRNLYLIKKNSGKHYQHTLEVLVNNTEENIDIDIEVNKKLELRKALKNTIKI